MRKVILIILAVGLIGGVIWHNYTTDQIKIKGNIFSNEIEGIQNDLAQMQTEFSVEYTLLQEGDNTKEEFLKSAEEHFVKFEKLIVRYGELNPPEPFIPSVDLFEFSAESQLKGDRQVALWIETGDKSYSIRADELYQEAFTYELSALGYFEAAKIP